MRIFIFPLFFLALVSVKGQSPLVAQDSSAQTRWVEERYGNMTLEERLGQLFMVMVASDNKASEEKAKGLVQEHHIGGVIFSTGGPVRQAKMTNELQALSKTPLLVGMDAEWGLSMRLDSTFAFPWNMTLGAVQNNAIIERIGQQIGKHSKRLGVHINFAPVLDININPKNPIIGNRSFGEDRENVTQKASALMKGMHSGGILSCGKHFPGHGDTATDSHHALPIIDFSKKRLDSIELYPYRKLIDQGLNSVMVAHLGVPNLEIDKKLPSSLSEQIVSVILKEQMKFKGLVLTDALNMKGVTEGKDNGDVEVSAFLAGNDILLMPTEVGKAKEKLIKAYKKGRLTEERLAHSVKKILMAKYKVGLNAYKPAKVEGLYEDLNDLQSQIVYEEAMENAITVVKNDFQLLSIKNLENKKIAYVKFGKGDGESFLEEMNRYAEVDEVSALDVVTLKKKLTDYNLVIIGHHTGNKSPWESYKFTEQERRWLRELALEKTSNLVLVSFAKPYALSDVKSFVDVDAVVVAYQNSIVAQKKTAQLLFGAIPAHGVLPVSVHPEFAVNSTCQLSSLQRLGYSIPERVGMSSEKLREVDRLVKNGLDSLMYPGAQVLIARHGKVIYAKSFGSPTYGSNIKVDGRHKYDLASMTKILATLPLIMKMEEEDRIELNDTFQELIPEYAETEIANVTVLKALSHYGRLPAWIAYYVDTLDEDKRPSQEFYRQVPSDGFSIQVAQNLYLSDAYRDSIYNRIGRQSLKSNRYRYSDVPYYVMKKYIEKSYNGSLDKLANDFLYKRLGAVHTTFNPLQKFPKQAIIPSEEDNYFRYQTVQGYVHDMGAAMQGGIGGHAGLFSNANDVAKIMQMYIQGGYYGGQRFFDARTVKKFNTCYFCHKKVRRGVGFDKPQLEDKGPTCGCVSRQSFGHSGFTGTYTWADPEEEIVYVFLSNRTYPRASNRLLVKSGLRTRIQKAIYDSILN